MKKVIISFVLFLIVLGGGELYLRSYWGFCDAVLMQESDAFEYIAQPNQKRQRFKKTILYNAYSMRSPEIASSSIRILGLGDSVINGGTLTDQDSIATTLLTNELSESFETPVQVLNISAGSWGPDNCMAYIREYGDFGATAAFLLVSSHDAYDNMEHTKVVDVHKSFPSRQYVSAIAELVDRYVMSRLIKVPNTSEQAPGISKNGLAFNTGFQELNDYFDSNAIPFFIYLHPEKEEVANGSYNEQGQEIIAFCKANNITLIEGLGRMELSDYRDNIHPNEKGQKKIANSIKEQYTSLTSDLDCIF